MSRAFDDPLTERVLAATELGPDIVSILGADGTLLYNSPVAERIHGYPAHELVGRNTMELVHPDDLEAVQQAFARLLDQPDHPVLVQYRYRHRDGGWTWMEATGRNQLSDPRVRGIVAISRDMSAKLAGRAERIVVDVGTYDPATRQVFTEAGPVPLTAVEARLLEHLGARAGEFVSTRQLLTEVWGYAGSVRSRTVYVAVDRLRRKVERDPSRPRCLLSRHRVGYALVPPGGD